MTEDHNAFFAALARYFPMTLWLVKWYVIVLLAVLTLLVLAVLLFVLTLFLAWLFG